MMRAWFLKAHNDGKTELWLFKTEQELQTALKHSETANGWIVEDYGELQDVHVVGRDSLW